MAVKKWQVQKLLGLLLISVLCEPSTPVQAHPCPYPGHPKLTLNAGLQAHLEQRLTQYQVPEAAVVVMQPTTGKILAYVSHRLAEIDHQDLVLDASAPAASVFKIVTAAALLDSGVKADARVCYNGGMSQLTLDNLRDDPSVDQSCASLSEAMGGSINAVFAKLANKHLSPKTLGRYASAFGFGHALPFDVPTQVSAVELPEDTLEFARTAAGFWHVNMSALHAALIAATIANEGRMPRAWMVDQPSTAVDDKPDDHVFREVISKSTAHVIGHMMLRTVEAGTARGAFYDKQGKPFLPGIRVAGKTGSLSRENPYRGYTWWVGFAPYDRPQVAVAALVVNSPLWRIKASYVAREALRYVLVTPAQS